MRPAGWGEPGRRAGRALLPFGHGPSSKPVITSKPRFPHVRDESVSVSEAG